MLVKCFLYVTGNHDRPFMGGAGAFTRTYFAAYKLGIKKKNDVFTSLVVRQVNQRQVSLLYLIWRWSRKQAVLGGRGNITETFHLGGRAL